MNRLQAAISRVTTVVPHRPAPRRPYGQPRKIAVLLKPGHLTAAEYDLLKQHTLIGDRLCGELRSLKRVRPIVRHHHERFDGSGYPDRLRGAEIPLLAQIIGSVDVFDAITMARPYKPAQSAERANEALAEEAARGWRRADLVETFITLSRDSRLPHFDMGTRFQERQGQQ